MQALVPFLTCQNADKRLILLICGLDCTLVHAALQARKHTSILTLNIAQQQ